MIRITTGKRLGTLPAMFASNFGSIIRDRDGNVEN